MYFPGNRLGIRQITLSAQLNGVHGPATITAGHIHIAQAMNGCGNHIHRLPAARPQHLARLDLVGTHTLGATHNHLRDTFMHDHQWGGP